MSSSTAPPLFRVCLGTVLRACRVRQGRTLRDVADSGKVSLGYLSEVERGRKEVSSEMLTAICVALDVPLWRVLRDVAEVVDVNTVNGMERTES